MWIVEEGERYLPEELDFEHEAGNMRRCRRNLDSSRYGASAHGLQHDTQAYCCVYRAWMRRFPLDLLMS